MHRAILSAFAALIVAAFELAASGEAYAGGLASYYGNDFAGRPTANGEIFNPGGMTAASLTLPFGTLVRVTNRHSGRSVVVRINDRGPYVGGRVIDLSLGAASAIGMLGAGVAAVELEIVGSGRGTRVASNEGSYRRHAHKHARVQLAALGTHHHRHVRVQLASLTHRHNRQIAEAFVPHRRRHPAAVVAEGDGAYD